MSAIRLALTLLRREAAGDRAVLLLPVTAFAVVTALTLTVLGGAQYFFGIDGEEGIMYGGLAVIAVTLLVIPLLTLCGAAARLSARRRDRRLSTLALLGAPGRVVTLMSLVESMVLALTGTLLGVAGHLLLTPLVGLVPFRGAPIGAGEVLLGPGAAALCVVLLVLLAGLSAVVGLRRVSVSPLGVRIRQRAPGASLLRLLGFGVALVAGLVIGQSVEAYQGMVVFAVGIVLTFGLTMAALNLLGPLVLYVQARLQLRRARGARALEQMLAARTVLDSPRASWRQVGGIAMTSFAAVFGGVGLALAEAGAGRAGSLAPEERMLFADIRTGVVLTLIISFVTVSASVAVNQAADLLDRRELFAALDRLGMPASRVEGARTRAVMGPLLTVAVWSAGSAAVLLAPFVLGFGLLSDPRTVLTVAGALVGGLVLVRLTMLATRPVLARVMAGPLPVE